jgi:signal transduction histidine kinase
MPETTIGKYRPTTDDWHLPASFRTDTSNILDDAAPDILDDLETALRAVDSPLLDDDVCRGQLLAQARAILAETAREIRGQGRWDGDRSLARQIGTARAAARVHPVESLRAAGLLFGSAIRHLADRLAGEHAAGQIALAASALHAVLNRGQLVAADAYVRVVLDRLGQAQSDERHRISRELHDRIGHGIGVAHRNLELFDIYRQVDSDRALARMRAAQRELVATLDAVRQTISDLRLIEPMESLEKALKVFLDSSAGPDLVRHVEVNGDETRVQTATIEEAYLTIRESLRNVVAHAGAGQVRVRVDILPTELRASVVDDGRGFDPARPRPGGTGLISMRERVALLGGSLTLHSVPGKGTHAEFRIPLPARGDVAPTDATSGGPV